MCSSLQAPAYSDPPLAIALQQPLVRSSSASASLFYGVCIVASNGIFGNSNLLQSVGLLFVSHPITSALSPTGFTVFLTHLV